MSHSEPTSFYGSYNEMITAPETSKHNPRGQRQSQKGRTLTGLIASAVLIFGVFTATARAGEFTFSSGDAQVALVELYTSEGCSSCPPAERYMSTFLDSRNLWKEFVPLAFHVDYWDYIGWKDPFASADYTKRQRKHAARLGMRTIYTPGYFSAGNEWRHWRKTNPDVPEATPGVLEISVKDDLVIARFTPKQVDGNRRLVVHVATLGFDITSSIDRGENAGRTLEHDFVVLGDNAMALERAEDGSLTAKLSLPTLRAESKRRALAAWVSYSRDAEPLQATGGWITQVDN